MSEAPIIMMVEDDRYIALALKIRLSAAGYNVLLAHNVETAYTIVDSNTPVVSLCDVNLPDGNGLALMEDLLARVTPLNTMFIIMSASRVDGLKEEALAKGASAFLEKPFSSKDLLVLIEDFYRLAEAC